jgi:hypothetical protein
MADPRPPLTKPRHHVTLTTFGEPTLPQIRILGFDFELATPYAAGHTCSANEAQTLNRALVKGISKGMFKVLTAARGAQLHGAETAALSEDQRSALHEAGLAYIAEFTEGFALGHERTRAIRIECERIARQLLEAQCNAKGASSRDLPETELQARLAELVASEKVRAEAERRVQVTLEIAQSAHADLLEG